MEQQGSPRRWWQTLPGVLTALGTLIGALAALIVALDQVGFFEEEKEKVVSETTISDSVPNHEPSPEKAQSVQVEPKTQEAAHNEIIESVWEVAKRRERGIASQDVDLVMGLTHPNVRVTNPAGQVWRGQSQFKELLEDLLPRVRMFECRDRRNVQISQDRVEFDLTCDLVVVGHDGVEHASTLQTHYDYIREGGVWYFEQSGPLK